MTLINGEHGFGGRTLEEYVKHRQLTDDEILRHLKRAVNGTVANLANVRTFMHDDADKAGRDHRMDIWTGAAHDSAELAQRWFAVLIERRKP